MEFHPDGDDNDEDDGWEDLPSPTVSVSEDAPNRGDPVPTHPVAVASGAPPRHPSSGTLPNLQEPSNHTTRVSSSSSTQITTTTKISRRSTSSTRTSTTTIVSHPLEHVGSTLVWHLLQQLLDQSDGSMRGSLVCFMMGAVCRIVLCSCYIYLYPQTTFLWSSGVVAVLVPWLVWHRGAIEQSIVRLLHTEYDGRDWIQWIETSLTSQQLRVLLVVVLHVVPTLVELETYHFLIRLVGLSTTVSTAFLVSWGVVVMATKRTQCPLWLQHTGLYLLYGAALWVALFQRHQRHIPVLASRFCLATAVVLYQHSETRLSNVLQTALRGTLRDALTRVGDTVQQDELLQLTMLRWIVDYWSTGNHTSQQQQGRRTKRPAAPPPMEWEDLATMLHTTARQMNREVHSLQTPPSTSAVEVPSETEASVEVSSAPPSSSIVPTSRPPQQARPTPNDTTNSRPNHSQPSATAIPPPRNDDDASPIAGLQAMFAAMDMDESAQPAIQAYKTIVQAVPPSRTTALAIAVGRRLPATWLLLGWIIWRRGNAVSLVELVLLAPFVALEFWRLVVWMRRCQAASTCSTCVQVDDTSSASWDIRGLQQIHDPMVILLVDERPSDPTSSLLGVWRNIESSVSALEMSLTAARAVQTTVVAADFCVNMISLVNFGVEVSQRGWFHGAQVLVRELTHLHATGTPIQSLTHGLSASGGTVTSAAVSAVRNSERMTRNLQALAATEETTGHLLGSLLAAVPLVVGHGWLWGKDGAQRIEQQQEPVSTVRIEEIVDEPATSDGNEEVVEPSDVALHPNSNDPVPNDFEAIETDVDYPVLTGQSSEVLQRAEETSESVADITKDNASRSIAATPSVQDEEPILNETTSLVPDSPPMEHEHAEDDSDNDDSFEALEDLNLGDCATLCAEKEDVGPETVALEEEEEEEEDNVWLKVGGSFAVVGAVIGAVAVAHHNISEGKRREQSRRNEHSS